MCGICGIYNIDNSYIDKFVLNLMTKTISHRGNDDEGFILFNTQNAQFRNCHHDDTVAEIKNKTENLFNDFNCNLGFGQRRMSIFDLWR